MELTKLTFLFGASFVLLLSIPDLKVVYAEGSNCVSSCEGVPNGDYHSCYGCKVYATCSNGLLYDNRPCPADLVWDDNKKRCEYTSPTCEFSSTCQQYCDGSCVDDKLCDGHCDCSGCTDERSCEISYYDEACGADYVAVRTGSSGVSFCSAGNQMCPGSNSKCVLCWDYFGVCCKPKTPKPKPCCEEGELKLDLSGDDIDVDGELSGVSVQGTRTITSYKCAHRVLVKANFERIDDNCCFGCLETPFCGRRMLKVELQLGSERDGYMFNAGDSISNNGNGGDSNHQQNDAEVQVRDSNIDVYFSDRCNATRLEHMHDAAAAPVSKISMYFSNENILISNDNGDSFQACDDCLFALNGQNDTGPIGGPNEDMFFAINAVVGSPYRYGYGVCQATFNWACPCDD